LRSEKLEAEYIFPSLDSDKKLEKPRRSSGEAGWESASGRSRSERSQPHDERSDGQK
jgi:hypothetical protein